MIKRANIGNNKQPSFVGAYYLEDESVCDELIRWHDADGGNEGKTLSSDGGTAVDISIKDSNDVYYHHDLELRHQYLYQLNKCLQQYKEDMIYSDMVAPYCIEALQTQRYAPGGGYHEYHSERMGPELSMANRHLVYMTYLNDIIDAGETEFFYQQLKVEPRKGLTLIWPSDWTHTHRGIPSLSETKYIATGWWHFTPTPGDKYTIVI